MLGHQEIKKKPRNPRGDLWLQLDICEKLLESFNDLMNAEAAAAAAPEAQEGGAPVSSETSPQTSQPIQIVRAPLNVVVKQISITWKSFRISLPSTKEKLKRKTSLSLTVDVLGHS